MVCLDGNGFSIFMIRCFKCLLQKKFKLHMKKFVDVFHLESNFDTCT